MSKPQPADRPTRRTIESFLRHDLNRGMWYDDPEYKKFDEEIDRLTEEFCQTPKMKKLKSKRDVAYCRSRDAVHDRQVKIAKLRRLYNTYGLTPRVIKEFQKLAEELNRDSG